MALSEYKELSRQSSSKRTLQDCTSLLCRGGAPKYCEKGKFHALNQRCIRNHKIDDANARRIENPRSREKLLRYGDILICSTGTGTLGRSAQVLCHDERVTVDSHVTIVRPAYEALVEYLGCWALSSEDQFESMAKGSTGQTELPRTELAELEIGFPDAASLNDFSGKTKPLFEAIQSNVRENQSLECLRDALLPKLMSGEIDVSRIGLRQLNGHLAAYPIWPERKPHPQQLLSEQFVMGASALKVGCIAIYAPDEKPIAGIGNMAFIASFPSARKPMHIVSVFEDLDGFGAVFQDKTNDCF